MSKKNINNSKSNSHFNNYTLVIKFNYKNKKRNKLNRKDFFQGCEYSCDIEIEYKPELNKKHRNEIEFRPSSKQTIAKDEYKRIKKKYNIEEIDEREEIEQIKEDKKSKINKDKETPPLHIKQYIYSEQNIYKNQKISDDEEDNLNYSSDDNKKREKEKNKNNEFRYKYLKGIKNIDVDCQRPFKFYKKENNKKNEDENAYQKLLTDSKHYSPFKDYDIKKFLLNQSQIDKIKRFHELNNKYSDFLLLIKMKDEIDDQLIKTILKGLNNIYKNKYYLKKIKVNTFINEDNLKNFEYISTNKSSYFDLFIFFISIFFNQYEKFSKSIKVSSITKLTVPLSALTFIFSSQIFFCVIAKLIQSYYLKFLSDKIIHIYTKEKEEYRYRIDIRKKIWKQFESTHFFYKNKKLLYSKEGNKEGEINNNSIKKFSEEIVNNIKLCYNDIQTKIIEKHKKLNEFNIKDSDLTIINRKISAPSSLYQQISKDISFKLKMNLYKYKMRQLKIKRIIRINDSKHHKYNFNNIIKNKIFKQSVFYMSPYDVAQDFLDN